MSLSQLGHFLAVQFPPWIYSFSTCVHHFTSFLSENRLPNFDGRFSAFYQQPLGIRRTAKSREFSWQTIGERQCASPQDVAIPTLFKCSEPQTSESTYATAAIEPLFSLRKIALG
jgi:hypothetical protein